MTEKRKRRMWISDCARYIAIETEGPWGQVGNSNLDVIANDGSQIWLNGRYTPKGWDDTDPRIKEEFRHRVWCWSNDGHYTTRGRFVPAFTLGFVDYDEDWNIVQEYSARFSREITKLAPLHRPIPVQVDDYGK